MVVKNRKINIFSEDCYNWKKIQPFMKNEMLPEIRVFFRIHFCINELFLAAIKSRNIMFVIVKNRKMNIFPDPFLDQGTVCRPASWPRRSSTTSGTQPQIS